MKSFPLCFTIILILIFGVIRFGYGQYPNIQVSKPWSTDPEEVSVAINPANPQQLAAGANISYYYYSSDGGLTWDQGDLTSTLGVWGDPCVNFDGIGNLYYGHLSVPANGNWLDRIVVQKSLNGGVSWNDGAGVGLNPPKDQDKEWLVADETPSIFNGNLYMSWTEFDEYGSANPGDSSRILFSRSADAGVSWSVPLRISDHSGDCIDSDNTVEGAVPAVGPDGQVYVAWSGPLGIMFDKSLDGGVTFGKDIHVTDQPGGWDFAVSGIYRCNGMPVTLCDISSSAYRGTIYVVWSDQRNGSGDTDVFLKKSQDGGQTWTGFQRVNDDSTTRHQFFHWAAVDPISGFLYVVFYDRRNTTGYATDVYVARSIDGGSTFDNFKVSNTSFTPNAGVFFGDYTNIAAYDGKIYPIWMRMDDSDLSVWLAIIDDTPIAISDPENVSSEFRLRQNYPNPFNSSTRIAYSLPLSGMVEISLYDITGQKIASLLNEKQSIGEHEIIFNAESLPSGIYYYTLRSGTVLQTRKMALIR